MKGSKSTRTVRAILFFEVDDDNDVIQLTASGVLDGDWHHVAAIRSGDTFSLFIDGSLADMDKDNLGSVNNSRDLHLGTNNSQTSNFDGLLDEVRLYDRALTSDDVLELSQSIIVTNAEHGGLTINEGNSNNAYLEAANGLSQSLTSLTFEARFQGTTNLNVIPFISYNTGSGDVLSINTITRSGWLELDIGTGSVVNSSAMDYRTLFDNEIHSLSVTWDNASGDWEIYVDGGLIDSGSGLSSGHTIATGGTLVLGQEQDGVGSGYDHQQVFSGTLYDVRLFDDVRTSGEISANHDQSVANSESGLITNWIFDHLSPDGVVMDAVSGNNLVVNHIDGSSWVAGTPSLRLQIDKNSANGTVVGAVTAFDTERSERCICDQFGERSAHRCQLLRARFRRNWWFDRCRDSIRQWFQQLR